MSIDAVGTSAGPESGAPNERQQIARLAQEFEAMLMTQMLREMRRSMLEDESHEGLGLGAMTDTLDVALGQALSRVGGFGLSSVLGKALDSRLGSQAGASTPSAPALIVASPLSSLAPHVETPETAPGDGDIRVPQGSISSGFGWRRDPINGVVRFHKGIDVAQPYGHDVRAAAPGQVVTSGDHGDYGTTIVVDHGGGQLTRYAHLSAASVRIGDRVESGQVIGKVGDSGRATGAHLHFEVMENGQVVNPTRS